MQAENEDNQKLIDNHKYFEHFIKNASEEDRKSVLEDLEPIGPPDDINSYEDYGHRYNKFIEFWTNQQYLNTFAQIATEVYDENLHELKKDKINDFLKTYNDGDSNLHNIVNNFEGLLCGFHNVANRTGATKNEIEASKMNNKYNRIESVLCVIKEAKDMNAGAAVNLEKVKKELIWMK